MIAIARAAMMVLTYMFLVGVVGSLIVVIISFFEDLGELVGRD